MDHYTLLELFYSERLLRVLYIIVYIYILVLSTLKEVRMKRGSILPKGNILLLLKL